MFSLLCFILNILFNSFRSKQQLLTRIIILEKELEIYKRKQNNKRLKINQIDRIIFSLLNKILNIKDKISIAKPEILLKWQKQLIKSFLTFNSKKRQKGRPPVPAEIKNLILKIKNENISWGAKKIKGELLKLDIDLDTKTIRNILRIFRRKGKIKKSLKWKKILKLEIFLKITFSIIIIFGRTRELTCRLLKDIYHRKMEL